MFKERFAQQPKQRSNKLIAMMKVKLTLDILFLITMIIALIGIWLSNYFAQFFLAGIGIMGIIYRIRQYVEVYGKESKKEKRSKDLLL